MSLSSGTFESHVGFRPKRVMRDYQGFSPLLLLTKYPPCLHQYDSQNIPKKYTRPWEYCFRSGKLLVWSRQESFVGSGLGWLPDNL